MIKPSILFSKINTKNKHCQWASKPKQKPHKIKITKKIRKNQGN